MSGAGSQPEAGGPDHARVAGADAEKPAAHELPAAEVGAEPPADLGAPERRWVWMDRWDPGTWEMPSNPTKWQRVMAAIALIIVAVMTLYLPFKVLGIFK